jgi:hypothetical protein
VHAWADKQPPPNHWIAASWVAPNGEPLPVIIVRTTNVSGVYDKQFGNLTNPLFWRFATPEEIATHTRTPIVLPRNNTDVWYSSGFDDMDFANDIT